MKSQILSQWSAPRPKIEVLSKALAEFRQQLERDAGAPVCDITANAALILDDLCTFLDFGPRLRAQVLGSETDAAVEVFLDSRVEMLQ